MMVETFNEGEAMFDGEWGSTLGRMVGGRSARAKARVLRRLSRREKAALNLILRVTAKP